MKTKKLLCSLLPVLILSLAGCSNSDEISTQNKRSQVKSLVQNYCPQIDIPTKTIDEVINCPVGELITNLNENYAIIRSQAEFNALVSYSGDCPFNTIDFSVYDLVIGKKQLTSGNQFWDSDHFTIDCTTKKLRFHFWQNAAAYAPNVTYHALIPKLNASDILQVETIVHDSSM